MEVEYFFLSKFGMIVTMVTGLIIFAIIVLLIVIWFVMYNSLVKLRNRTLEGFAQIDTQLQRRGDLIPNLVSTVKGYAKHEATVLKDITAFRSAVNKAHDTGQIKDVEAAEDLYSRMMLSIKATAEAYPDLKASDNFRDLQEELTATENRVAASRQYYNTVVNKYNTKIETVPFNIIASIHNFDAKDLFTAQESARNVPTVEF